MKTSELTGPALDWLVAKCKGAKGLRLHTYLGINPGPPVLVIDWEDDPVHQCWIELSGYSPSTDWDKSGPIIEREFIEINCFVDTLSHWSAMIREADEEPWIGNGDTPLIAAMRCYVESKLGDEVEIPEELK